MCTLTEHLDEDKGSGRRLVILDAHCRSITAPNDGSSFSYLL